MNYPKNSHLTISGNFVSPAIAPVGIIRKLPIQIWSRRMRRSFRFSAMDELADSIKTKSLSEALEPLTEQVCF